MPDPFRQKLAGTSIGTTTKVGTYKAPTTTYKAPSPRKKKDKRDKGFREKLAETPLGREVIKAEAEKSLPPSPSTKKVVPPPPSGLPDVTPGTVAPTPMEQKLIQTAPKIGREIYYYRVYGQYRAPTQQETITMRGQAKTDITPTGAMKDFGYRPYDPDYVTALKDVDDRFDETERSLEAKKTWVKEYPSMLLAVNKNISAVRNAPDGSTFEVDLNADGNISEEEMFTKEEALDFLEGEKRKLTEQYAGVVEEIPALSRQLRKLTSSKEYLEEYRREGYELTVTDEGEYSFSEPKASEVVEAIYGKRPELYMIQSMRSGGIGTFASAVAQDLTGDKRYMEAEVETLASGILFATKKKGENIYEHHKRFWQSPEVVMDIYVPILTLGLGVGTKALATAGKTAGGLTGSAVRLTSTGVKTAGAVVGLGLAPVVMGVSMGVTAYEDPYRLPGDIGRTGYRIGLAYGMYKYGEKLAESSISPRTTILGGKKGTMRSPYDVTVESPDIKIIREVKPSELGIRAKSWYGKDPQIKAYEYSGHIEGTGTRMHGYLVTSDKPVVLEVFGKTKVSVQSYKPLIGTRTESISYYKDVHPALRHGSELYLTGDRQFTFGTTTSTISYKGGEYTSVADYFGFGQKADTLANYFKPTTKLTEPGVTSEYFTSKVTTIPRAGGRVTTTGVGLAKSGYKEPSWDVKMSLDKKGYFITTGEVKPSNITKIEFIGESSPRTAPWYSRKIIIESGTVRDLTGRGFGSGHSGIKGGFSSGKIDVIKPSGETILYGDVVKVQGVQISTVKAVSGITGVITKPPVSVTTTTPTSAVAGASGLVSVTEQKAVDQPLKAVGQEARQFQDVYTKQRQVLVTPPALDTKQELETDTETRRIIRPITGMGKVTDQWRDESQIYEPITEYGKDVSRKQIKKVRQATALELQLLQRTTTVLKGTTVPEHATITPKRGKMRLIPGRGKKKDEPVKRTDFVKKTKQKDLIRRTTKRKRKSLFADILSVTQSHARHGKATHPRLTKKIWKEAEERMFIRVPTKELIESKKDNDELIKKKRGGRKRDAYY